MSLKRDIIVLISIPILFVSTSFLVNIGKEMSLLGFRTIAYLFTFYTCAGLFFFFFFFFFVYALKHIF